MRSNSIVALLFVLFWGCSEQNKTQVDEKSNTILYEDTWSISSKNEWLRNDGLMNVESIIYDSANQVFYATNGVNYELGTTGFISRISKEGTLQELKWVSALNRPTGMAIYDSLLFVADVNTLVVVNTHNGQVVNKYKEPHSNSGLNDVAINKQGEVFVSASFTHAILKLRGDQLELFIQDEQQLQWANGLTFSDDKLIVAGLSLSVIELESMKITPLQVDPPIKDFDGITADGENGFFLTTVENSALYHLSEGKKVAKLLAEDIYFGDLEFNRQSGNIYVPRGDKQRNEFYISVFKMDKIVNE